MTPDEINVAIAEHLGWTQVRVIPPHPRRKSEGPTIAGNPPATSEDRSILVPDYCGSLDAMHEPEESLVGTDRRTLYLDHLYAIVCDDGAQKWEREWFTVAAKAAQRAEAFLRTIGKWRSA